MCRTDARSEWESDAEMQLPPAVSAELERILPLLPADVVAFEITPAGCGVYWRERGDEATVRLLKDLLEAMQRTLLAA